MAKAADAFRTISEVSSLLDTPTHVLRFWESKFSQIKPVKRAGGRRYYRPQDIALLGGIKHVLHDQGMTIKGAQKLLREEGVKHVASLGEGTLPTADASPAKAKPEPKAEKVADAPKTPAPAPVPAPKVVSSGTPFFAFYTADKAENVRANAAKIAPLVAKLEAIHARMR